MNLETRMNKGLMYSDQTIRPSASCTITFFYAIFYGIA
jgi:hypothetical protein